ncbi:MAG TPA: ParB/RepB/Spo0J family partition protein [Flavobacteriales bacterium]|mgnify:FL=1|nr:ParB/RepB/Spo0J family partition protein [Flavobacteriales bacterium]HPH81758.1 ParB/RepB/Spo0J family partition protein [Flavobacteriales bacterium]
MNNKRNALGKGLGALLTSPETDITTKGPAPTDVAVVGSISELAVDQIEANPFQPRTYFEEEALRELAESIQEMGLIQPVTVRKLGYDKYQLISGERRFRASQMAGLRTIPAYIRIANDQAMLEMALVENIQREELDSIEIALAYQRLIEEVKLTQEEVSEKVAKKRSTVANYLRLLKLPPEIQLGIRERKISMGHARALVAIEDPKQQLSLYNQILSSEMSVRQVEEATRKNKQPESNPARSAKAILPAELKAAINSLHKRLEVPVDIKTTQDGKGQLNIRFNSPEELAQLLSKLIP